MFAAVGGSSWQSIKRGTGNIEAGEAALGVQCPDGIVQPGSLLVGQG